MLKALRRCCSCRQRRDYDVVPIDDNNDVELELEIPAVGVSIESVLLPFGPCTTLVNYLNEQIRVAKAQGQDFVMIPQADFRRVVGYDPGRKTAEIAINAVARKQQAMFQHQDNGTVFDWRVENVDLLTQHLAIPWGVQGA
jgi:hypothetical protein